MTAEERAPQPSFRRIRWEYLVASMAVYLAVERWFGVGGVGLLLVLNLVGVLYANALRIRGPFSRR